MECYLCHHCHFFMYFPRHCTTKKNEPNNNSSADKFKSQIISFIFKNCEINLEEYNKNAFPFLMLNNASMYKGN